MTHHGVSQTLHFLEMIFFVVFGDKKVSWIPGSHIEICGSWPVQASKNHVTTSVFSVTEYKRCTQTSKIIPFLVLHMLEAIDSIATCILQCAICILQKNSGTIFLDSKSY